DMLIDAMANNELLSLMDSFSGYNQILIAKDDVLKITFRCPGSLGTFEWLLYLLDLRTLG
ncbi:hypothetical protein, partial [Heyndrickxia coagulans]|uniref:hypothetical protein n=1 Tax=Heyndrickxia coagulans TaxID=1398 RepID=UPI00214D831C